MWNNLPIYSGFFTFQAFQLIIYQYLGSKNKVQNGKVTAAMSVSLIFFFIFLISFLLNFAY